jgi:capsular polysaccharide biosynthesis protein
MLGQGPMPESTDSSSRGTAAGCQPFVVGDSPTPRSAASSREPSTGELFEHHKPSGYDPRVRSDSGGPPGDVGPTGSAAVRSSWEDAFQFSPANLIVALVVAFLVAGLSAAVLLSRPARFESTATVAVDQPSLIASGGDRVIDKLARLRVKYAPLVRTDLMTEPLAKELGTTPGDLRSSLSATTPIDNLLILVTARTGNRSQSQTYAATTAEFLVRYARDEQVRDSVPSDQRFELVIVDQARPGAKIEPSQQRALAVTLVAGLAAGGLAYVVLQLARPRSRRSEEP